MLEGRRPSSRILEDNGNQDCPIVKQIWNVLLHGNFSLTLKTTKTMQSVAFKNDERIKRLYVIEFSS